MESSTGSINIVVWTSTEEAANKIAHDIVGGCTDQDGQHSGTHNGATIRVFTRSPGVVASSHPQGVADALIISIEENNSTSLGEAKSYIDNRRGIPFKYIHSLEDFSEVAAKYEATYINDLTGITDKIVNSVKHLDTELRTAFSAIDLNGNGVLSSDELVSAAAKLGHNMNSEEAKLIIKALSKNESVDFDGFKTWWVRGRGDFNSFRQLVKVEMKVGELMKKGSEVFNEFVKNLKKEEGKDGYKARLNISSVEDFETGFGMDTDLAVGAEYDDVVKALPQYFKENPVSISFEINVNSEEQGHQVKATLESLYDMLMSVPQVSQVLGLGFTIRFRNSGNSVFIDVSLSGSAGDKLQAQLSEYNFESLNFTGSAFFNIFTGLRISDLLSGNLDNIINRLSLFKLESHSQVSGVKNLIYALTEVYEKMGSMMPRKIRKLIPLIKVFAAMKNFEFEFRYDANEVASAFKEFGGQVASQKLGGEPEEALESVNQQLGGFQSMAPMMIDQFKPMIDGFIEPFKPALTAVNFDTLAISYYLPSTRMFYKLKIHLPGTTNFIKTNLFGSDQ
jgi:hypothetical protein